MNLQEALIQIMHEHAQAAIFISLAVSTLVAILGLVPSVFVTGANIFFFGWVNGTLISIAGESLGAAVSFVLYRYFFRGRMQHVLHRYPAAQRLLHAKGKEAATLVFSLRLLPMVPSGIITFAAAVGHIGTLLFIVASTIGKIPALLLEAALVQGFLKAAWPVQIIMVAIALALLVFMLHRKASKP